MSEYQLPRLFDDFGQAWIRISCNFSSSSGAMLPLSLSSCTLGIKKQSKVTGSKLLLLLCQMKLSFCYVLHFGHLLVSRERFAVRRGNVGFLGEEIFFQLKPHFFCPSVRTETASPSCLAETCSQNPQNRIKQIIIRETHFPVYYIIQQCRIHS